MVFCRLALALIVALSVISVQASAGPASTIRIGLVFGLTGPNAFLSQQALEGANLAVEEINKQGGVLGRQIQVTAQDSQSVPVQTVNTIRRLVTQDNIKLIIGPSSSGEALTVMPIIQELQAVMIIPLSSSPVITTKMGKGGNPWVFRVQQPDDANTRALARAAITALGDKRLSTLAKNDDFGRVASEEFTKNVLPSGGVILSSNFFSPGGGYDYSSTLTRLKQENPQGVVFFGTNEDFVPFMKQYAEQGLKAHIYTRSVVLSEDLFKALGTLVNGVTAVETYFPEIPTAENRDFVARYMARWKRSPATYSYTSYVAVAMLASAIRAAGTDAPASVRESLTKVRYKSITGTFAFNQYNQALVNVYVGRVDCSSGPCHVNVVSSLAPQ